MMARERWLAWLALLVASCSSSSGGAPAAAPDAGGEGADGGNADSATGAGGGDDAPARPPPTCAKSLRFDPVFGTAGVATGAFGQISADREDTLLESQRLAPFPDGSLAFTTTSPLRPQKLAPNGTLDATFDP